jgi:hypothetical protein
MVDDPILRHATARVQPALDGSVVRCVSGKNNLDHHVSRAIGVIGLKAVEMVTSDKLEVGLEAIVQEAHHEVLNACAQPIIIGSTGEREQQCLIRIVMLPVERWVGSLDSRGVRQRFCPRPPIPRRSERRWRFEGGGEGVPPLL